MLEGLYFLRRVLDRSVGTVVGERSAEEELVDVKIYAHLFIPNNINKY